MSLEESNVHFEGGMLVDSFLKSSQSMGGLGLVEEAGYENPSE